jgi:quinoprotein glucose dehydrogenase
LVFVGASLDATLRAFDVTTGNILWQAALPAPAMTVPMSYTLANRQFIVVAAGGSAFAGTELADTLVAFSLTAPLSPDRF